MSCGCNALKATGDPHGRSITALSGLKGKASKTHCAMEGKGKRRKMVCRNAKGQIVKRPVAKKRSKKR